MSKSLLVSADNKSVRRQCVAAAPPASPIGLHVAAMQPPGKASRISMFGVVCGGRPVRTDFNQISPERFALEIADAAKINHVAVFLLPGAELPPGTAVAVYAKLPSRPDFALLGSLTNERPSAIFRFRAGSGPAAASHGGQDIDAEMELEDAEPKPEESVVALGLALENAEVVASQLAAAHSQAARTIAPSNTNPELAIAEPLAKKILSNLYTYLGSFADSAGRVPLRARAAWSARFKPRLGSDPEFLGKLG